MEAAIRAYWTSEIAYNAGQVRNMETAIRTSAENMEAAIRAYNAGQVRTWRQLSELIILDK